MNWYTQWDPGHKGKRHFWTPLLQLRRVLTLFGSVWFSRTTLDRDPKKGTLKFWLKNIRYEQQKIVTPVSNPRGGVLICLSKYKIINYQAYQTFQKEKKKAYQDKMNIKTLLCYFNNTCLHLGPKPLWCIASPWKIIECEIIATRGQAKM